MPLLKKICHPLLSSTQAFVAAVVRKTIQLVAEIVDFNINISLVLWYA
jgi:hypothetical protein